MSTIQVDTVVIGGGPAGTTVGCLLKKYDPNHKVLIVEREVFPRDHIGESQLPVVSQILDEMGCWDKVEAANFPIKIGATYRWGTSPEPWNFEFVPNGAFTGVERPGRYVGERTKTAFQVDRAVYDKILLDHAQELGCEVLQPVKVTKVNTEGDRITSIALSNGQSIEAKHYVDASGAGAVVRKAMKVEVDSPTSLRNIAIWNYWQNAEWATSIGVGGTRIQILSLDYGWIWFIPLGPTRTSIGLVLPAAYYRESGLKPEQLYERALAEERTVAGLISHATPENKFETTSDWSFLAERLAGENWFLTGDSCGFADPILSAGMTLAQAGAREVAYLILELEKKPPDADWLRASYSDAQRRRIRQHIRFADYWYSVNGQFKDLVAYTSQIAKDSGLTLAPDAAFQWLGTGGFANDGLGSASIGTFSVAAIKQMSQLMSEGDASWEISKFNEFRLNLLGIEKVPFAFMEDGQVFREEAYVRDGHKLPLLGPFKLVAAALANEREMPRIMAFLRSRAAAIDSRNPDVVLMECLQALEAMVAEGWVTGKLDKKKPVGLQLKVEDSSPMMYFEPVTLVR